MKSDFDWTESATDGSMVFPNSYATVVYQNLSGDVVIRQQNPLDDDSIIVIPAKNVGAVIAAMRRAKRGEQ